MVVVKIYNFHKSIAISTYNILFLTEVRRLNYTVIISYISIFSDILKWVQQKKKRNPIIAILWTFFQHIWTITSLWTENSLQKQTYEFRRQKTIKTTEKKTQNYSHQTHSCSEIQSFLGIMGGAVIHRIMVSRGLTGGRQYAERRQFLGQLM